MNSSLVSVVIPTYKREPKLIRRAVNSVLNQTYPNIEIVIVDDSPNDYEYRKQVEKYARSINNGKIKYIKHSENLGANKARNTGIDATEGDFCAFLDDDDEWVENKIEKQLKEFTSPDVALVYCKAIVIDENSGTSRPMINTIKKGYYYDELLKQNFIGSNSYVIIRKDILLEIGKFDENLESNQDYDLFLRIAKKYKIAGVDDVLVKYYDHDGERITSNPSKQLQGRLALYMKYKKDISRKQELKLIWKIKNIPLYYKAGEKSKAYSSLIKLFFSNPIYIIKYLSRTFAYRKELKKSISTS